MRPGILLAAGIIFVGSWSSGLTVAQTDRPVHDGVTDAPPVPPRGDRPGADHRRARSDEINIVLRRRGDGPFEMYVNGELIAGPGRERYWRALLGPELFDSVRGPRTDRDGVETDAAPGGDERRLIDGRSPERDAMRGDGEARSRGVGRPPWMGGDWAGRDQNAELTDERVREMLDVIGDFDEPLHDRLTAAMERNPERVREQLRRERRVWVTAVEMRRRDPERYALNVEERRLGRKVGELIARYQEARQSGDEAQLAHVQQELRTRVTAQYDVREKIRERDLMALEDRLIALRKQVIQRRAKREEVIDGYLAKLLERRDDGAGRRRRPDR